VLPKKTKPSLWRLKGMLPALAQLWWSGQNHVLHFKKRISSTRSGGAL
jgi:hypothetical protein